MFLAAFLTLFLELALIRWLSENIIYLSYFTNFVLIASFLGIGLGFLTRDSRLWFFGKLPLVLLALVSAAIVFPVEISRPSGDVSFVGYGEPSGAPIWLVLTLVFGAVTFMMVGAGQLTASYFGKFDALTAYRLDILGALAGIVLFTLLSFLGGPPFVWAVIVAGTVGFLGRGRLSGLSLVGLAGLVVVLGAQSLVAEYSWSPYYRLELIEVDDRQFINTNGIPHQAIAPVAELEAVGALVSAPYSVLDPAQIDRVLVVGAGNGNDVAYALAKTGALVDAVEIDPGIARIGELVHPDRPYDDDRVTLFIDDGRAFLENTEAEYDLILFALPDSLTLVSGQSSLRLESYLFTVEAFEAAQSRLSPSGVFAMYNAYPAPWVIDRLAATAHEVFGQDPCVDRLAETVAMIAVGPGTVCENSSGWDSLAAAPIADDRPFLYIRTPGIPGLYLVAIIAALLGSALAVGAGLRRSASPRGYGDLFFMGAAFLLLETKSIVLYSLWFGATWVVNSLVFAGVLLSVLAAIEVTRRASMPLPFLYVVLGAALAVAWVVPPDSLLSLSLGLRWFVASVLTFTPIFVANLVFAERFRTSASSTTAFGINLLGAIVGGVIEYMALVTGYRALVVVVGLLYSGAFLLWRRQNQEPLIAPG